jgi:sulfur relay (sulfurtransferase) DsrC/TusE family protein
LNIENIEIKSYPEGYLTEYQSEILQKVLSKLNFQVKFTEQNYEILITDKSFYETVLGSTAKQLLRTHAKKGYVFNQEYNLNFEFIHAFIARSRERKNRPMTMSLEQLTEHVQKFYKNFQLFSVTQADVMVATGITIKINDDILYTFYLADDENYLKDSPTTFLLSGIYEYGKQNGYKILDCGIATNKGVLNVGLARFKQSLGAKMSKKKTYFFH